MVGFCGIFVSFFASIVAADPVSCDSGKQKETEEKLTMLKVYFHYIRYTLSILATVGFGLGRN